MLLAAPTWTWFATTKLTKAKHNIHDFMFDRLISFSFYFFVSIFCCADYVVFCESFIVGGVIYRLKMVTMFCFGTISCKLDEKELQKTMNLSDLYKAI